MQRCVDELPLLDAIRLSVIATDADGVVSFANEAAAEMFAATGDLVGHRLLDFLAWPEQRPEGRRELDAVLAGATWHGDLLLRRLDGTRMVAAVTATPVRDPAGDVRGSVVVCEDMTEVRQGEARREAAERRLRLAHEAAGLGAWQWEIPTGRVSWDARLEEIFGLAPGEYDGTVDTWMEMLHPDDRAEMIGIVQQAMTACSPYVLRTRIVRPDGTVRTVESFGRVTADESGKPSGSIGVVRDVTDERATEHSLERAYAEQRLAGARSELLRELMADMVRARSVTEVEQAVGARLVDLEALLGGRVRLRLPASLVGITDGAAFLRAPTDLPAADLVLLDDLAAQAGLAAARAHHQGRTAEIADHLQRSLAASPLPDVAGVELAVHYAPGGHRYAEMRTNDWTVALAVGDVMGRGVQAATTMIRVRAGLRALVTVDPDPCAVVAATDRLVSRDAGDPFVTAVVARIDPTTRTMQVCNAGHVPVAVVCPDGRVRLLGSDPGVPLGLVDDLERDDEGCRLTPGSMVVLVTDGVVESRRHDLEEGIDRFVGRVGELATAPLAEVVAGVAALADTSLHDDVTVVAARIA